MTTCRYPREPGFHEDFTVIEGHQDTIRTTRGFQGHRGYPSALGIAQDSSKGRLGDSKQI